MQEIHTKLLISRLSLVQNIFYHYIHGMKRLIIPIICMLLPLAGCHERKQLPSLNLADSLLTDAGDKSGALRIFLQIEEQLQSRQDPYNKGLLYERIGSIYYGQMNYVRAYHYFKQARENFQVSDSLRKETEATLDMAASSYRQKDLERAIRLYSAALDLADEQADERLAGAALSNLASLYVKSGRKQIPQGLLQRIEQSARKASRYSAHTMVDVQLLKHHTDSARHYLQLAEAQDNDVLDRAELQYTAYRIEALSGNFRKATDHIHRYIYLTDSLTRSTMQVSAGITEKEYFQEQSAFAEYRMKNRIFWETTVIHPRRNSRLYHPPAPAHPARTHRPLPAAGGRGPCRIPGAHPATGRTARHGKAAEESGCFPLRHPRQTRKDLLRAREYPIATGSHVSGSKTDNHRLLRKQ